MGVRGDPASASSKVSLCLRPEVSKDEARLNLPGDLFKDLLDEELLDLNGN